jgi:quinoprotein glucose dehydrogenase
MPFVTHPTRLILSVAAPIVIAAQAPVQDDWPSYGRTPLGDRHSPLVEITRANVGALKIAWRYHTGETGAAYRGPKPARLSATPIVVAGRLFFSTPYGKVIALDAATGAEIWRFDGRVDPKAAFGDFTSRGVSYWSASGSAPAAACRERIFAALLDARLIALDARTGKPCLDFGRGGTVDLKEGLRNAPNDRTEYEETSPPAIAGNTVILGSAVADNNRLDAASGEVRGFDALTGRLKWRWDPIPQDPADPAFATWRGDNAHRTGAANAWSVIAADPARDLVVIPTSSPSVDYWGGARLGDNRYADSVVALRASTGEKLWSFQTVHHDLWDYDNAAPPALVTLTVAGKERPVVLQATKSGQLFVLDRVTGKPVFPVEERAVPASDSSGETASLTQPFSTLPALSPLSLTAADLAALPQPARAACAEALSKLRNEGPFTPPSERGSLLLPSNIGGAHWGGLAYDPASETVFVPVNRIASVVTLIPRDRIEAERARGPGGERLGLEYARMTGSPYVLKRQFFSAEGRLCTPPPYGSLHAISLRTGKSLWNVPLGSDESLEKSPVGGGGATAGMVNLGGPVSTASGLLFIGASPDAYLRAFDAASGRELWKAKLPAGARSTPMTYGVAGRQFVAIAAGGDGEFFGRSDEIVAFALGSAR